MITGLRNRRKTSRQACRPALRWRTNFRARDIVVKARQKHFVKQLFTRMIPEPTIVIEPRKGMLHLDLAAIWQNRVLLFFLVWRDLKIRYKQSVIGVGWVVLQPLVTMAIF